MLNTITMIIVVFLLSIAAARTAEDLKKKDKVVATIIYFVLLAGPTFLGEALLGAPHFGVLCSVLMVGLVTFLLYLARPKTIIFLNLGIAWLSFWQLFRWADAPGFSWWQVVWVIAIIAAPLLMWRALVLAKKKRKKSSIIAWILVLVSAAISIYLATAYTVGWWPVETKQVETKQVETKQEETKQEETKQEEMKQEETKPEEAAIKKALTFDEAFLANSELSKILRSVDLRFDDSSLLPSAKERNKSAGFSHAVAFPLADYSEWDSQTRNKEFFKQIIISVLKNPIMADMLAQGFVWDMEVPSLGTTVGKLNGNEFMEEFVTLYGEKGLEEFLIEKNGTWEVTPEFRKTAEKLAAILWSASRISGLETRTSIVNYASNGDVVISSGTRTYRIEDPKYQASSEALVLEIPNPKDYDNPEIVFGFNRHDRRLEIYPRKAETPEKPEPQPEKPKPQPEKPKPQPEKPQPKPQPEKPKPQPEKPQPKPQPEPEPQPKPQPTPPTPKKPESDPSQKGRADIGGGPNQIGDGKGVFQKEEPKSSETLETENVVEIKKIDNGNPPSDDPDEKNKDSNDSHGDKAGDDNGSFEAED